MMRSRGGMWVVACLAWLLTSANPALAHGDSGSLDRPFWLEPGESITADSEVHFHRLVGRVSSSEPVQVEILSDQAASPLDPQADEEHRINELFACCDEVWSPVTVSITNTSEAVAIGSASLSFIHDDLAVSVYGAEGGVREAIVILGVLWAWVVWKGVRRRKEPKRSLLPLLALCGAVLALAAWGMWRYGGEGPQAFIAATGRLVPLPTNPIASASTLALASSIFLWGWIGSRWARSIGVEPVRRWFATGALLIASAGITAIFISQAYDATAIPIASAIVSIAPPMVAMSVFAVQRARVGT